MTDYYELMGQVHAKVKEEHARKAATPRNCFFCDYMASQPGFCDRYQARPPASFMQKEGACDQWLEEIPF